MNCQVLHRSTYQALTQDEWEWEECKQEHSFFMEYLHQRLGPHALVGDLAEMGIEDMLQYDQYHKMKRHFLHWMKNKR